MIIENQSTGPHFPILVSIDYPFWASLNGRVSLDDTFRIDIDS